MATRRKALRRPVAARSVRAAQSTSEGDPRVLQVPATMVAAALDHFGPPESVTPQVLPVPEVGPGEVLVALKAAGLGIWDAKIRQGVWAEPEAPFPKVLGTDGAGVVAVVGPRVRRLRVGQRVWAYAYENSKGGFHAEYAVVNADMVTAAPKSLDWLQAGAAPATGLTAFQGTVDHLRVRRGENVLVFGATGGVGTLAVQFAKHRGARVFGTASGHTGTLLLKRLGVDVIFDARNEGQLAHLASLAPNGFDAVLVLAGGGALEKCLDLVVPGGRVVYPNGVDPEPRPRDHVQLRAYDAIPGRVTLERLCREVDEAGVRVPLAAIYPLERAAEAHVRIERGHVVGRIVLRIHRSDR
jgi:NADPH:quinone reductase